MPRMSKKRKQEWALFLNERNRITYNELCRKCRNDCKQYRKNDIYRKCKAVRKCQKALEYGVSGYMQTRGIGRLLYGQIV